MDPDKTSSWGKRTRKGVYYGLNTLLPLSELRYTLTTIGPSFLNNLRRVKQLTPTSQIEQKLQEPVLSFNEAVAASGLTIAMLIRRFNNRKRLCLTLAVIPVLLAAGITLATVFGGLYAPLLLAKAFALVLSLLALAALPFFQALVCTWRLWQLHEHRASLQEHGGFGDFLAENTWFKKTLTSE